MRKSMTRQSNRIAEIDSELLDRVSGGKGLGVDPNGLNLGDKTDA